MWRGRGRDVSGGGFGGMKLPAGTTVALRANIGLPRVRRRCRWTSADANFVESEKGELVQTEREKRNKYPRLSPVETDCRPERSLCDGEVHTSAPLRTAKEHRHGTRHPALGLFSRPASRRSRDLGLYPREDTSAFLHSGAFHRSFEQYDLAAYPLQPLFGFSSPPVEAREVVEGHRLARAVPTARWSGSACARYSSARSHSHCAV